MIKPIDIDFSDLELRVAAYHGRPNPPRTSELLDLHKITAALMFNVMFSEVTADQRKAAKEVNFRLMYQPDTKWAMPSEKALLQIYTDLELNQLCMDMSLARPSRLYETLTAHFNTGKS